MSIQHNTMISYWFLLRKRQRKKRIRTNLASLFLIASELPFKTANTSKANLFPKTFSTPSLFSLASTIHFQACLLLCSKVKGWGVGKLLVPFLLPTILIEGLTTSIALVKMGNGGEEVVKDNDDKQVDKCECALVNLPDFIINLARTDNNSVSGEGVIEGGGRGGNNVWIDEEVDEIFINWDEDNALSKAVGCSFNFVGIIIEEEEEEFIGFVVVEEVEVVILLELFNIILLLFLRIKLFILTKN